MRPSRLRNLLVLTLLALGAGGVVADGAPVTSTTTTTTEVARPQPGWTVASRSARGVMVDYRNVVVGTTTFRVLRLRAGARRRLSLRLDRRARRMIGAVSARHPARIRLIALLGRKRKIRRILVLR